MPFTLLYEKQFGPGQAEQSYSIDQIMLLESTSEIQNESIDWLWIIGKKTN